MASITQLLKRRLSFTDSLLVLVVLAVVSAAGYELCRVTFRLILTVQARAAIPRVCDEIRSQRRQLVGAIEAYKAGMGFYPPDHVLSRNPLRIDAVTNQLLYELLGTVYDPTNETFSAKGFERVGKGMIKEMFNTDGFKNSASSDDSVKHFLVADFVPSREVHDDPDVNVLSFSSALEGIDGDVAGEFEFSSWHYVSSTPTNNPGRFDLWIEVKAADRAIIIGNWQAAQ